MPRITGVREAVLAYLDEHPNQTLHLKTIAADLNYPTASVQRAMVALRYSNVANAKERLVVQISGHAWLWKSATKSTSSQVSDKLYAKVYESRTGQVLIEDEDGNLFFLKEI